MPYFSRTGLVGVTKNHGNFFKKMLNFNLVLVQIEIFIFWSKNSTLISRENYRVFLGEKLVKMLWFWTF